MVQVTFGMQPLLSLCAMDAGRSAAGPSQSSVSLGELRMMAFKIQKTQNFNLVCQ